MKKIIFIALLLFSFGASAEAQVDIFGTGIKPAAYKVWRGLISQNGSNAPTAIVLQNELGGTIVFTYDDTGDYSATLVDAFPADKTSIIIGTPVLTISGAFITALRIDNDFLKIYTGVIGLA